MSKELTKRERKARIRKGLPIEALGLQFYPITMDDYEEFLECKSVLALRMTSLAKQSIEYLSMPFLSALWAIEIDSLRATGKAIGFIEKTLRILYLSLRLEYDVQKVFENIQPDMNDPRNLLYIQVMQDGKTVKISPLDFTATIRPLIAEQNGILLPDESENPDIIQAENVMNENDGIKLKIDNDTLIASVANACHLRENEIFNWTICEFERRRRAIEREKNYMLYTQAEMSGMVKFNNGNPYPSWCFDREGTLTSALITVDEMNDKYKGAGNVKETIAQQINTE